MRRYIVYALILGTFCYVLGKDAGQTIRIAIANQQHQLEY